MIGTQQKGLVGRGLFVQFDYGDLGKRESRGAADRLRFSCKKALAAQDTQSTKSKKAHAELDQGTWFRNVVAIRAIIARSLPVHAWFLLSAGWCAANEQADAKHESWKCSHADNRPNYERGRTKSFNLSIHCLPPLFRSPQFLGLENKVVVRDVSQTILAIPTAILRPKCSSAGYAQ